MCCRRGIKNIRDFTFTFLLAGTINVLIRQIKTGGGKKWKNVFVLFLTLIFL